VDTVAIVIALASTAIAVLTFVSTQFGSKRASTTSYVEQLERRVTYLETRLEAAEREKEELHDENFRLLRRLAANGA
jgi:hypothetical protein